MLFAKLIFSTLIVSNFSYADLKTVDFVDVDKFVGVWYQISGNPLPFDKNCVCSRQVLSLLSSGEIGVYNSCNKNTPEGPLSDISGTAENIDSTTNAKFKVDFGLPFKGDYWIIALDPQYRYAVVSDPAEFSLYILSREPELNPSLYAKAVSDAKMKTDVSKLKLMPQQNCTYP